MILDTSAVIAILLKEPEAPRLAAALRDAGRPAVSAATLVEIGLVAESRGGPAGRMQADLLLETAGVEVVPLTEAQARLALEGWRRFGRGRHPAGLNLGDCFAYALAQDRAEPLLFKGEDFARTDVKAAI